MKKAQVKNNEVIQVLQVKYIVIIMGHLVIDYVLTFFSAIFSWWIRDSTKDEWKLGSWSRRSEGKSSKIHCYIGVTYLIYLSMKKYRKHKYAYI